MQAVTGIHSVVQGWNTVRYELLNMRLCDLALRIEGSPMEPHTRRLLRELDARQVYFKPDFYLTDAWGCPDRVPVIGIPFYLADPRLARLEEEQSGEIEDGPTIMKFLRHEAGHAVNYAYRLWKREDWVECFGVFTKPYRDEFQPRYWSRSFVRHIDSYLYGRTYAQKHPDDDFAETFAVWLTPRSGWRRRYRGWPALRKLRYVDRLMKGLAGTPPPRHRTRLYRPVENLRILLAEHYGQKAERLRRAAQGYVDDKLREIFPPSRSRALQPAGELLRGRRGELLQRACRWSGLEEQEALGILEKLEERAAALNLSYPRSRGAGRILDAVALVVALSIQYATTGRFSG
jgi:hypothetical protein